MWRGRAKLSPPTSSHTRLRAERANQPQNAHKLPIRKSERKNLCIRKSRKKGPGSVTTPRPSLYSLSTSQPMLAHLQTRQLKATQRQVT